MKLALCVFKYFPYGGLQRNFLAIAQELIRRGHEVRVFTRSWEGDCPDDVSVTVLPVKALTNHAKNRQFHEAVESALTVDPVDLVVGFNKMPGLDVYYCADTCFATRAFEEKGALFRLNPRSRWALKYERAVFAASSKTQVLLLSANEGRAFEKYYGTPATRMHLMPPGISRTRVRDDSSDQLGKAHRKTLGISEQQKVIAFLGSDYKRKGLDRIVRAVASLPDNEKANITVLVIGRDKRKPAYEKLAKSLGVRDNVLFVGQRDDVPALLFASDYLAHPAYLENTGNVLLEAAVAGLPVICSGICGYAFYIEEYHLGTVVPEPFDQSTMNQQLDQLLKSDIDWRRNCAAFARSADIYSRPLRAAECIEAIGAH